MSETTPEERLRAALTPAIDRLIRRAVPLMESLSPVGAATVPDDLTKFVDALIPCEPL